MSTDVFVRHVRPVGAPRRRRWTGVVLAVVIVAVTVLVSYEPPSSGLAFDPRSREELGLAVVVDVLRELDVDVEVRGALPLPGEVDVVLAPPLGWQRQQLVDLAESGARVVAVVPPHPDATAAELAFTGVGLVTRDADCAVLADVDALRSPTWRAWLAPAGTLPDDTERCIRDGGLAWATVVPIGDGELVALGTLAPLVNARMDEEDAAVAAVRLLDVRSGDSVVALGEPGDIGDQVTLVDLIDRRWFDAAWLSLFALVVAALSRGRRLGRPIGEELPVRVPSGELARALGDLRHRAGADAAAAEVLRERTLGTVGAALGLGRAPSGEDAVAAVVGVGIELADADAHVLREPVPTQLDHDGLTATAARLAAIRELVRHGARRAAHATSPTAAEPDAPSRDRAADHRDDQPDDAPEQQ